MSNIDNKQELSQMVGDIMSKIDFLPLHPKYKFQLYNRYILSRHHGILLWQTLQRYGCLKIFLTHIPVRS